MKSDAERAEDRRSVDLLAAEICTMAGHINAATYRFLQLIAEFDRRKGWADNATHSCAHWLNWARAVFQRGHLTCRRSARATVHGCMGRLTHHGRLVPAKRGTQMT